MMSNLLPIPYPMQPNTIYNWDALTCARSMRACGMRVNAVVTSPPYFQKRDYSVPDQVGQEDSVEDYIIRLVNIFDAIRDVLTDDGAFWLNLGSTFAGSGRDSGNERHRSKLGAKLATGQALGRLKSQRGFKPKDLIPIPHLVALALQANGWYLRCDVVWDKGNPVPESMTDRPTYALLQEINGTHYKIGLTTDPDKRMNTFSVKLPYKVKFVCLIETEQMHKVEKMLHQRFANKRINGEWFALDAEDVEYIKGLAS